MATQNDKKSTLARKIELVIFDVDGVMSDGKITYTNEGMEIKSFNVKDGLGIKLLQRSGIKTAIITGRKSDIVALRAKELGIHHLLQQREDKLSASLELSKQLGIPTEKIAYMGDDLPDLSAIKYLGFGITVANAHHLVKEQADYICQKDGGDGAVREACEYILEAQNKLDGILKSYMNTEASDNS